jgi:hypothetical protein
MLAKLSAIIIINIKTAKWTWMATIAARVTCPLQFLALIRKK